MIKVRITNCYNDSYEKIITLKEFEEMLNDYYDKDGIIDNRTEYNFEFIVE